MAKNSTSGQSKNTASETLTKTDDKRLPIYLKHKHIYELFVISGEVINFTHEAQDELLSVYQIDFPHHTYNKRCPACVAEFLSLAYRYFESKI